MTPMTVTVPGPMAARVRGRRHRETGVHEERHRHAAHDREHDAAPPPDAGAIGDAAPDEDRQQQRAGDAVAQRHEIVRGEAVQERVPADAEVGAVDRDRAEHGEDAETAVHRRRPRARRDRSSPPLRA